MSYLYILFCYLKYYWMALQPVAFYVLICFFCNWCFFVCVCGCVCVGGTSMSVCIVQFNVVCQYAWLLLKKMVFKLLYFPSMCY